MTGALTFHRPGEVAPRLAVSENLLRTLARAKKIPCVRLTGRKEIRFTDGQLQTIHQYLLDNGLVCAAPAVTRTSSDAEPALDENVPTALAAAAALLTGVHPMRGSRPQPRAASPGTGK